MNYINGRGVFVCKNQCLSDVVGIAWSHSGAVFLEYKAKVLSTWFSTFIHTNLLWKCVCSQGFYELEAKFTALDSNHTDWGTNDDLLELFFSHSKVKKTYMKWKAFNNLPWNPVLIILNVGVTILCMMCAVTQLTLKEPHDGPRIKHCINFERLLHNKSLDMPEMSLHPNQWNLDCKMSGKWAGLQSSKNGHQWYKI